MTDQKRLKAVAEAARELLDHGGCGGTLVDRLRVTLASLDSPLPTDEELLELATEGHPIAPSAVAATLAAMRRGYAHALRLAAAEYGRWQDDNDADDFEDIMRDKAVEMEARS